MGKIQKKFIKKRPHMYIEQPNLPLTKVSVQQSFKGSYRERVNKPVMEKIKSISVEDVIQNNQKEISQSDNGIKPNEQLEDQKEGTTQSEEMEKEDQNKIERQVIKKPFKYMSNEEKIISLLNRPKYIPKPPCEVKTEMGVNIGTITSFENNFITIRTHSSLIPVSIPLNEIVSIKIKGL